MLTFVSWRFVTKDSLCVVDLLDILRLSHLSLESLVCSISSESCHVCTSTVTALVTLSLTLTFERYPVVPALVAELTTVAMSKLTDSLAVWDEDPDSFDDFAAQRRCDRDGLRKPEQGLATAHVVRLFAARGGKTWNLIQRLDNRCLQEWFGLESLLWRIREEICRPAIPETTKDLDEYVVRLKRNKQESMSAGALRVKRKCISRCQGHSHVWGRRLPRPNLTGTCCTNVNKTGADGTIGPALG